MNETFCRHVYEEVESDPCPICNKSSHKLDWAYQNKLRRKWLKDNHNAKYQGWWSI